MKKRFLFALFAALTLMVGCSKEEDDATSMDSRPPSGNGLFSVAEGRQVRFAPGNLVYENDAYRFAEHQYDYGGLFGWGTGSNPTETSTDNYDYPSFDDWGSHIAGGWRTLTIDEWRYVILNRPDASSKRGAATLCGVHGIILLPDDWEGSGFTPGFDGRWFTNVYDAESWSEMEASGAVFLPAAGFRYGSGVHDVGDYGGYWSATPRNDVSAYHIIFDDSIVSYYYFPNRSHGQSVRLAQDNN